MKRIAAIQRLNCFFKDNATNSVPRTTFGCRERGNQNPNFGAERHKPVPLIAEAGLLEEWFQLSLRRQLATFSRGPQWMPSQSWLYAGREINLLNGDGDAGRTVDLAGAHHNWDGCTHRRILRHADIDLKEPCNQAGRTTAINDRRIHPADTH